MSGDQGGNPKPNGHMTVVTASVHHALILRGVLGVICLGDRQCVHVEASHHYRAGTVTLKEGYNAGLGDAGLDVVAERAKLLGDDPGGAVLLERQLGVSMEVTSPGDELFAKGLSLGS
jgi:hypothetical protein